jgi:hypothetical protein
MIRIMGSFSSGWVRDAVALRHPSYARIRHPDATIQNSTHPAFAAAAALTDLDALSAATDAASLQAFVAGVPVSPVNADGRPVKPVTLPAGGAAAYERRIRETGELAVRPDTWHDRLNVLAWCLFPRAKAALNARHVADLAQADAPVRSRVRDALTLFDEDGIVVACTDPSLQALVRAHRWTDLFVDRRADVASRLACVPFGHALMEKLLDPFVGLTAKARFVDVPPAWFEASWRERIAMLDTALAATLRDPADFTTPRVLTPLPVLGLPGWWEANTDPRFYENRRYFRASPEPGSRHVQERT